MLLLVRAVRETEVSVERCSAGTRSSVCVAPAWNIVRSRVRRVPTSPGASSDTASPATMHPMLQVDRPTRTFSAAYTAGNSMSAAMLNYSRVFKSHSPDGAVFSDFLSSCLGVVH